MSHNLKLVKRRGKVMFVLDLRPSKRIRRAQARIQKRLRESHEALKGAQCTQTTQKGG